MTARQDTARQPAALAEHPGWSVTRRDRTDPMNPRLAEDLVRVGQCVGVWAGIGFTVWQGPTAAVGFATTGTVITAVLAVRHRRHTHRDTP